MERTIREQFSDMAVVLSIKEPNSKAFYELYTEMVQFLYSVDEIYTLVDTKCIEKVRGISIPLALTKEKFPAIYIFTDKELAMKWCDHYRYFYNDGEYPIAVLKKEDIEYMNVFQLAMQLGIYKAIVNEGDRLLCMNIADMIKVNGLSTQMMGLSLEKIEEMLKQGKKPVAPVRFNSVRVLDFKYNEENQKYIKDVAMKALDDFKELTKEYEFELLTESVESMNGGTKLFTVFFENSEKFINAVKDKKLFAIEKAFFDAVNKYDEKKLFDNRYSYIKFETRDKYKTNEEYLNAKHI